MINENQHLEYRRGNIFSVLLGTLIGGLAGAVAMLLLAPQSGEDTRMQIQKKGLELRDLTAKMVEDTVVQVRAKASKVTVEGREKIKGLKEQGQELVVEQLDHVAEAAQAGKKAIQSSKG
jgi:gas vesicle protein